MKARYFTIGLLTLSGFATSIYADVQNIRISGDIRTRGHYFAQAADANVSWQGDSAFIEQRTRVSIEVDLQDRVLLVASLKAEGLWGAPDQSSTAGPGTEDDAGGAINRGWSVGFDEAYVQFSEMF